MTKFDVTLENLDSMLNELESVSKELPNWRKGFAVSLITKGRKYKKLSESQMFWVGNLIEIALFGEEEGPKAEVGKGFAKLVEFFKNAKPKFPKITVEYEDAVYKLSLAGPNAKKPGWVRVTDDGYYPDNKWFGWVSPDGVWEVPRKISEDDKTRITRLLTAFSEDAEGAAAKYGKLTGNCCFCGHKLSDEKEGKSIEVGYGPVCAKNYGLPWGKKT